MEDALSCRNLYFVIPQHIDREVQNAMAEGQDQEAVVDDISVESFGRAIKWMFTGNLALLTSSTRGQDTIARLIDFLNLADDFGLLDPFDSVYDEIKSVLVKSRSCLTSQHIRWAMGSPAGNPIRIFIMKACVKPFIESIKQRKPFKFHRELVEFESFAAGLIRYFAEATSHRRDGESKSGYTPMIRDPLTEEDIKAEFDKE